MTKSLRFFIRKVYWRIRSELNLPCNSPAEIQYRLNRLRIPTPANSVFNFPWGEVHYQSASDLRGQYTEIYVQRHYALTTIGPNPVIVDAGGNIGMSAIWFKQAYPDARITVYEADQVLSNILRKNLGSAQITDVQVFNAAVWTSDGFVSFDNRGQDKGMVSASGSVKVQSIDLATHLPDRVDLLKLDIEGAEYGVIRRLSETGALSKIHAIVAEFHIGSDDIGACLEALMLLRQAGMQVSFKAEMGSWLGKARSESPFEIVGTKQILAEVYAWR